MLRREVSRLYLRAAPLSQRCRWSHSIARARW